MELKDFFQGIKRTVQGELKAAGAGSRGVIVVLLIIISYQLIGLRSLAKYFSSSSYDRDLTHSQLQALESKIDRLDENVVTKLDSHSALLGAIKSDIQFLKLR